MSDSLRDSCGVFGIFSQDSNADVTSPVYLALYALQHRGQESCGIAVCSEGVVQYHNDLGLVPDVFSKESLARLGRGNMALGHVRYCTRGRNSRANAQPLVVRHKKGTLSLAHNGSLTNAAFLREKLEAEGAVFHTGSDPELIVHAIARKRIISPSIEAAVEQAVYELEGAYSLVIMSARKMIAVRDPHGFRPLCMGSLEDRTVFASESCALDSIGATFIRDIEPGEIVVLDGEEQRSVRTHCGGVSALCVFEFIYFARPDSVIAGASVHTARQRAGAFLSLEHPVQADVVIGVPDSGLDAALGFSRQSGIPYGVGFVKNRYIGRTFIQPSQEERDRSVRIKLNTIEATVRDKRVVLVDDSIVRGTTMRRIVSLLRESGAKEIHLRISSPPFVNPCYFGTDIDSRDNLIACRMTTAGIRDYLGADSLGYLSIDNAVKIADNASCSFCHGCFSGAYPVPEPAVLEKNRYDLKIGSGSSLV